MIITISRGEFAAAVTFTARAVPRRAGLPVLSGMLVSVDGSILTLAAFNYEMALRSNVSGTGASAGQILVDSRELRAVTAILPKPAKTPVTLSADDEALTITSDGSTWTLPALPGAGDYPALPQMPPAAGTADAAAFSTAVADVTRAAGRDETLPSLTCTELTASPDALRLAATDRYRLAWDEVPWVPAALDAELVTVLVPAEELAAFAKKAAKSGKVSIFLSAEYAGFRDDHREMIIRTNGGRFIRWQRFAREESPYSLTVSAPDLAAAVTRAGAMTSKDQPVVLRYADDALTVTAERGDGSVLASRTLPAAAAGADVIEVRFSAEYLGTMLAGISGKVTIGLMPDQPDEAGPATIIPQEGTFRAVVVPVRHAA